LTLHANENKSKNIMDNKGPLPYQCLNTVSCMGDKTRKSTHTYIANEKRSLHQALSFSIITVFSAILK